MSSLRLQRTTRNPLSWTTPSSSHISNSPLPNTSRAILPTVWQLSAEHSKSSLNEASPKITSTPPFLPPLLYRRSSLSGELLLDQQRFEDAAEKFDRAIELEKLKPTPNVLPLVNKGLALFQWKKDIGAAERCCGEALRIDPECEAAVATLAQLNLQQSKISKAAEYFRRQAELARSEPELQNALTYQYVSGGS